MATNAKAPEGVATLTLDGKVYELAQIPAVGPDMRYGSVSVEIPPLSMSHITPAQQKDLESLQVQRKIAKKGELSLPRAVDGNSNNRVKVTMDNILVKDVQIQPMSAEVWYATITLEVETITLPSGFKYERPSFGKAT